MSNLAEQLYTIYSIIGEFQNHYGRLPNTLLMSGITEQALLSNCMALFQFPERVKTPIRAIFGMNVLIVDTMIFGDIIAAQVGVPK